MLVNPAVDVGDGTVYRQSREVTGSDDSLLSRTLLESSSSEEGIGASSPVQILP